MIISKQIEVVFSLSFLLICCISEIGGFHMMRSKTSSSSLLSLRCRHKHRYRSVTNSPFPTASPSSWSPLFATQGKQSEKVKANARFDQTQPPVVPALRNVPFRMKDVISPSNIEAIRFRHIQLDTEELALECQRLWESGDMEFDQLAKTLSTCTITRDNGGDSGWIQVNAPAATAIDGSSVTSFPLELINECYQMTKGDVSILSVKRPGAGATTMNTTAGTTATTTTTTTWHLFQLVDVLTKLNMKEFSRKKESIHQKSKDAKTWKTYTIDTMGCQMNVADSERMEAQLVSIGYQKADVPSEANVVIINTCSIRDHAEQKVYSHLGPHGVRKKKGEDVTIIVAGCVAQQEGENLIRRFPVIDIVMGPQYSNRIVDMLESALDGHQVVATDPAYQAEDTLPALRKSDISAFVNVIYGCNEHCTYCVVPNTRGVEQSRTKEAIVKEVEELVANGYREVTLLGQNIDAWGRDMSPKQKFADLLDVVAQVKGLDRLRFLTSHPRYMSKRVTDTVAKHSNLMPCFYVPFQSGDNHILKMMRRGYSHERFLKIIENIRESVPDAAIIADCIVGFPGETEEQFQQSLALMEEVKFDLVNIAAYSPRPGTPAAHWDNQIDEDVKQERLQKMRNVMMNHALERSQRFVGTIQHVLVDDIDPKHPNFVSGRNPHNRLVFFEGSFKELKGQIVPVLITEARPFSLTGRLIVKDIIS